MKVLVSGGAGYIGSILTEALLDAGHQVTVIDNFLYEQNSLSPLCWNPNFQPIKGDARDIFFMRDHLLDCDLFIPLAALVGMPQCARDPIGAESTNHQAIAQSLHLLTPYQKVIFPNTNSGYGVGKKNKECTEDTPLLPISHYGRTKMNAEIAVLRHPNSIVLRLATVFGMSPRMRLDLLVNDFVYRAITDKAVVLFEGHFKRNYIHVRDVARALLHCIDNFESMKGKPYNVGLSNANLSKLELCEKIKQHIPKFVYLEAPIGEDIDKRDYIVSNARIEATGFTPQYSLDWGIDELIKGLRLLKNTRYGNA